MPRAVDLPARTEPRRIMAALTDGNGSGNGSGHGSGHGRAKAEPISLIDRLPPQNIEAEQGVLGSILLDNDVLHDVVGLITVEDFYRNSHQVIFRAIRDLYDLGKAIDAITLVDDLIRRDQLQAIGGHEVISQILNSVPHAANAKYYAGIVREKAVSRLLIDSATEILRDGYSNSFTAEQLLESAERKIFDIAEDQTKGDTVEIRDVVALAMDR